MGSGMGGGEATATATANVTVETIGSLSALEIDVSKDWKGYRIVNIGSPSANMDVANKRYADELIIHQASQAEGTSDISTTSATFVDMPDMSITMTTGANPVLIVFSTAIYCSAADKWACTRILIDGAVERGAGVFSFAGGIIGPVAAVVLKTVTAAQHTIKVQWMVNSPATVYNQPTGFASGYHRRLVVIELKK